MVGSYLLATIGSGWLRGRFSLDLHWVVVATIYTRKEIDYNTFNLVFYIQKILFIILPRKLKLVKVKQYKYSCLFMKEGARL